MKHMVLVFFISLLAIKAIGASSLPQGLREAPDPAPLRTLLIDGGGIRGIVPAVVLTDLEKRTGEKISELFPSGITGTSTGAILAAALSCSHHRNFENNKKDEWVPGPYRAEDILNLYQNNGGHIFNDAVVKISCDKISCDKKNPPCCEYQFKCIDTNCGCLADIFKAVFFCSCCCGQPSCCKESILEEQAYTNYEERGACGKCFRCIGTFNRNCCGLCGPKYTNDVLRTLLTYFFGELTLTDVVIPLQIVSYKISAEVHEPAYFTGQPGIENPVKLVDAILASSAAPTFFPLVDIEGQGIFVDGGIFENSAGLSALRFSKDCYSQRIRGLPVELVDFVLLSIGNGEVKHDDDFVKNAKNAGISFWAKEAIEVSISGAAQASHANLTQLYKMSHDSRPHYFRLQFKAKRALLAMDTTDNLAFLIAEAKKLIDDTQYKIFMGTLRKRESVIEVDSAEDHATSLTFVGSAPEAPQRMC